MEKQDLIEAWKESQAVQRHFNEMCMKIRAFALTLVAAIITAESFAGKDHDWLPIFAALIAWSGFYFMDRWWYHYLLLGAVTHASDLEKELAHMNVVLSEKTLEKRLPKKAFREYKEQGSDVNVSVFSLTQNISQLNQEAFGMRAKFKLDLFYLVIAFALAVVLAYRLCLSL